MNNDTLTPRETKLINDAFSTGVSFGKQEAANYTVEERERYGLVVAQHTEYNEWIYLKNQLALASSRIKVLEGEREALRKWIEDAARKHSTIPPPSS